MSNEFVPMPERDRQAIRRRVVDWARQQAAVPQLSAGLLEGPGGAGPDLIYFVNDCGFLIYLTETSGEKAPPRYREWLDRWGSAGAPVMNVRAVESETEAREVLVDELPLFEMAPSRRMH